MADVALTQEDLANAMADTSSPSNQIEESEQKQPASSEKVKKPRKPRQSKKEKSGNENQQDGAKPIIKASNDVPKEEKKRNQKANTK